MQLGDRMKKYENVQKQNLMPRMPAIIRIDGKAFHTWTKGLNRPFDENMVLWMAYTTQYLVENIQNAVFGYCQSDEISILLRDYDTYETQQWFDGNIQKITSVSASMATAQFNHMVSQSDVDMPLALFDSRVFTLSTDEVTNYFIWRQRDCLRNSVSALARKVLGHKQMQGLKRGDMIKQMMEQKNVNWYELPMHFRNGIAFNRKNDKPDFAIPEFSELRDYVDIHIRNF